MKKERKLNQNILPVKRENKKRLRQTKHGEKIMLCKHMNRIQVSRSFAVIAWSGKPNINVLN